MNTSQKEFYQKISSAIKNNEHDKILSILENEIGGLMVYDRDELINSVKKSLPENSNIDFNNISDKKLALVISNEILLHNEKMIGNLVIAIVKSKEEYDNIIGLIGAAVQVFGGLVKGIADAVSAKTRYKAERDVAREGVKTQKEYFKAARLDLASGILGAKKKVEETQTLVEAKKTQVLSEVRNKRRVAVIVGGFLIIGVLIFVIAKKSS